MVGLSAPSIDIQVIQIWKEQSINHMGAPPSRGTSAGWRYRLTGTSLNSTTGSAKVCIWGGISIGIIFCSGSPSWKAPLQKWTWGPA